MIIGMKTERIVATGIYYYDMTNVEANSLQFRSTIDDSYGVDYPQNGHTSVELHYGRYCFTSKLFLRHYYYCFLLLLFLKYTNIAVLLYYYYRESRVT